MACDIILFVVDQNRPEMFSEALFWKARQLGLMNDTTSRGLDESNELEPNWDISHNDHRSDTRVRPCQYDTVEARAQHFPERDPDNCVVSNLGDCCPKWER